jgi:hypothetical protein
MGDIHAQQLLSLVAASDDLMAWLDGSHGFMAFMTICPSKQFT